MIGAAIVATEPLRTEPRADTDADTDTGAHGESSDLTRHLAHCTRSRGRLHGWRTVAEGLHAVLAPRFVSTVTVLLVVIAGLVWLLR